ncbi:MAG: dUTP diphosphatase [Defluviitaleaceae bacterium]|nr:dUTP diphosphatase [Defluviitaleaceae bacterium]
MQSKAQFLISQCENAADLPLPMRQSPGASGMDLYSNISALIKKGERILIPTGIKVALPFGFEAQIRPRSGLALKHGITVLNSPGTVDADYRGEVGALLINHGQEDFQINRGDRIAQMVIMKVDAPEFTHVSELPTSERGEGGYGSTG